LEDALVFGLSVERSLELVVEEEEGVWGAQLEVKLGSEWTIVLQMAQ
jgi:hypothetical protein